VRLGGQGKSTSFLIESEGKTSRYSSYYGKVWPGMEGIKKEDRVHVLAKRKKLDKTEIISGKGYYIWELVHQNQVIVAYEDIQKLVKGIESTVHRFVNGILIACVVFLFIAYIRKEFILKKN
jgi:hypothetical protein